MEENIQDIKRNLEEIQTTIKDKKLEDRLYIDFKLIEIQEKLELIEEYIDEYM